MLRLDLIRSLVGIALVAAARTATAVEFPYMAYVVDADVDVRSGPGSDQYGTAKLPVGYAVEVYRHDGAGWCAIRPPEGSFSFVPTQSLRIVDGRRAEVTAAETPVRVGGANGEKQNAVQVLLALGETVQLAEAPQPSSPVAKIFPPAGEFRWVAARSLSRTPPVEGMGRRVAATGDDPFAHLASSFGATTSARGSLSAASASGWQPGLRAVPGGASTVNLADLQIVPGSPAAIQLAEHETSTATPLDAPSLVETPAGSVAAEVATPGAPLTGENAAAPSTPGGPPRVRFPGGGKRYVGPLDPRVAEMELRLSAIVAKPEDEWQFAALRDETTALLAQDADAEVRDQLRDMLDQIAKFESIQSRRRQSPKIEDLVAARAARPPLGSPSEPAGFTGNSADVQARVLSDLGRRTGELGRENSLASAGPPPRTDGQPPATEALYDAVGTLKPVMSRRPRAPRFALVDDRGAVVSLVTPTANVDLNQYVGQRVGVNGSRGFMTDLRRAHVTASRVTPLEGTTRR